MKFPGDGGQEAEKKALTAAEETELNRLWRKLLKRYHPGRFAHEAEKLADEIRELKGEEPSRIG